MTLELADSTAAFPLELEREIFETMALMYPLEIPTLLRVARRVRIWIEPLLYRVIRGTDKNKDGIMSAIKSKPADFFANAVRHLCLDSFMLEPESRQILEVCCSVTNLALNIDHANPVLLPILTHMCLQRLSGFLHRLFGGVLDLAHPLFASLTHLDLFDTNDEGLTQILAHIPTLPVLTHLALDSAVLQDPVETLLVECTRLKLLLVLWHLVEEYESAQIPQVYDVRFVIGLCPADYWDDWEAGATGRPHFWSLGDDFVTQKRNKLIEETRYWL
ncbi:hypothetical protein B0H13DRAFT_2034438 [Mycena leptocephala]|nr:hypothetical protein B0H13DRAFT_2034438 [Mycena leptocephala]